MRRETSEPDAGAAAHGPRASTAVPAPRSSTKKRASTARLSVDGTFLPQADGGDSSMRVAVRVRPFSVRDVSEDGGACPVLEVAENTVIAKTNARHASEEFLKEKSFSFDSVFDSSNPLSPDHASQEKVFREIGVPIIENALDAYNGCLLAYGQTGSGKSFTVLGDAHSKEDTGILPRACETLFEMVDRRRAEASSDYPVQAAVFASYMEIYQEKMFDLLVSARNDLQVRVHPVLGPHVPSLTRCPVTCIQEVMELLDFGAKNRAVGATTMNAHSSRSHAIFTVDLRLSVTGPVAKDMQSKVHFVDLAGSEKQKKVHASGERLQEGIAINQSLSSLSRVIMTLSGAQGKNAQPPFRDSKLTLLLKDALSGNSRTVLMACVSPSRFNVDETVSTLEFAARCKLIKTQAKKNEQDRGDVIETLSYQKQLIENQLQVEREQRRVLEQELEREMRQARANRELAERMMEEYVLLQQTTEELQEARKAEEAKHKELLELQQEEKQRAEERQRALSEVELLKQAKEKEVAEAERERERALEQLEEAREAQEREQLEWTQRHRESEQRAKELEEALLQQAEDRAERERLEEERQEVAQKLQQEVLEKQRCAQEAERLREEREQQLRKADEEQRHAAMQLEELQKRQADQQAEWERLVTEKERQAQDLQQLREQEATAREREAHEREEANRASHEQELQRLEAERARALSQAELERRRAQTELQEQRRRVLDSQTHEAELRVRMEQEMRRRQEQEEDLKRELTGLQGLCDSWVLENQELQQRAQEQKQIREELLQQLGIVGVDGGEKQVQDVPRLVNLHADPMLEGCLIYYLQLGETCIGADAGKCHVLLNGLDVAAEVCAIENEDHESLTVRPLPGGFVRLNGAAVVEEVQLSHGDRLAIGRAHIFRLVLPRARSGAGCDRDEEDFHHAMQELQDCAEVDPKWRRGVDAAVLIVKRDFGTRAANGLIDEARLASEAVAEANAILQLLPKDCISDVSHYELAVLFEADEAPVVCVVARAADGGGGPAAVPNSLGIERTVSTGIWEAARFLDERLPLMREAAENLASQASEPKGQKEQPEVADWESRAWTEVLLEEYRELTLLYKELQDKRASEEREKNSSTTIWDLLMGGGQKPRGTWFGERIWDAVMGLAQGGGSGAPAAVADAAAFDAPNSQDAPPALTDFLGEPLSPATPNQSARRSRVMEARGGGRRSTLTSASSPASSSGPGRTGNSRTIAFSPAQRSAEAAVGAGEKSRAAAARRRATTTNVPYGRCGALRWPAADNEPMARQDEIVVGSEATAKGGGGRRGSSDAGRRGSSDTGRRRSAGDVMASQARDMAPQVSGRTTDFLVHSLFQGRLGVRLRMEGLVVTGFDLPEAASLGWQIGDEILAVNGCRIRTKDELRRELAQARNALPITFTVTRLPGLQPAAAAAPASQSFSTPSRRGSAVMDTE